VVAYCQRTFCNATDLDLQCWWKTTKININILIAQGGIEPLQPPLVVPLMKSAAIRRQTICRESLIRNVRHWKRGIMSIASVFNVLQSCDAGRLAGKFYVTDQSSSATSSCHKALVVVRTSSSRSKQHLKVRAAQIGLHNCIIFKNKSLTNSNKSIRIVTLRHNSSK